MTFVNSWSQIIPNPTQICPLPPPEDLPAPPPPPTLCDQLGNSSVDINLVNADASELNSVLISGQVISISGTLTIDVNNIIFDNCIFIMSAGSKIIVESGREVSIENSRLFSCSQMWVGIDMESRSSLKFLDNDIEDEQYAIRAVDANWLFASDNVFNRNHVGLLLENYPENGFVCRYSIFGNVFDCNDNLNQPYSGQMPDPQLRSYAGIDVQNVGYVRIGFDEESQNVFKNLAFGVIADNSIVDIYNSSFDNMKDDMDFDVFVPAGFDDIDQRSSGVYAYNQSYILVKGLGGSINDESTFNHLDQNAIKVFNSNLVVRQCKIENCDRLAIGKIGGSFGRTIIEYNTIISNSSVESINVWGARTLREDDTPLLDRIRYNNLTLIGNRSTGTDIGMISINSVSAMEVSANIITINTALPHNGIRVFQDPNNDPDWLSVSGNKIKFLNRGGVGVSVVGTFGLSANNISVKGNVIENAGIGLSLIRTLDLELCSNTLLNGDIGIQIADQCQGTQISNNIIDGSGDIGMLFLPSAQTRQQSQNGNVWLNNQRIGALNEGNSRLSSFIVNTNILTEGDPIFMPTVNDAKSVQPSSWFNDVDGQITSCGVYSLTNPNQDVILDIDLYIANDDPAFLSLPDASKWESRKYLFDKIRRNPLLKVNVDLSDFYDHYCADYNALFELEELLSVTTKFSNEKLISGLIVDLESGLMLLRDIQLKLYSMPGNTAMRNKYFDIYSQISDLKEQIENLLLTEDSLDMIGYNQCVQLNENLQGNGVFLDNVKKLNRIRLNYLVNKSVSPAQYDQLLQLAKLCYEDNGIAVKLARSLLPRCESVEGCVSDGVSLRGAKHENSEYEVIYFPNPAQDVISFHLPNSIDEIEVLLYSTSGDLMDRGVINSDKNILDVSNLINGLYFIQLWNNSDLLSSDLVQVRH